MSIIMIPVESSQITSIGHDEKTQTLAVKFKTGSVYHYANVPEGVYGEFLKAESIGKFFGSRIKNRADIYPYTKQPNK